jgi:iron complex outermembrane recepter protein
MLHRKLLLGGAAIFMVGTSIGHASAQEAGGDQAAATTVAASGDGQIEEVVVTARRRAEREQVVPTAIQAFDQSELTKKSIVTSYDLARNVPGLVADAGTGNPGVQQFSIRGRGLNFGAAAGSVETYFAEVPLSAPFGLPTLPPQFFDVNSLEVLKGPQGTLFGRSTTGGAVLITPQAPTDDFGGYVRLQGGSYGDFQAEGAINIPLNDKVILRVAGFDWQRDGYMHTTGGTNEVTGLPLPSQDYDSEDVKELRATLRLQPTDGLENTTILTYHWDQNLSSAGPGLNILGIGTPNGQGAFYSPGYGTRNVTYGFDLNHPPTEIWALFNTSTYDLTPDLTVKNIFGYINSSGYTNDGNSGTGIDLPPAAIDTLDPPRSRRNTQYTDELQLQGHNFDDRLTWVVGGLMDLERQPGALNDLNYGNLDLLFGHLTSILEQNTQDSYGLFGSGSFKITDNLNITVGYRHSFDDVKLLTSGELPGLVLTPTPGQLQHFQTSQQGDAANIEVDFHPTSQVMVYGGWRLGYKRGGFNATSLPSEAEFAPERVYDYFVGMKSDFNVASMPVRLNIEGYYDLYQNMQVSYYSLVGSGIATITSNVPKTTFRGTEVELTAKPTDWLTVNANYAYLDAFNTSWPDNTLAGTTGNLAINPVPYASRNKVSFTARFHTDLPNNMGEIAFAPTVSNQSKYYTTPTAERLTNATAAIVGPFDMTAHGGGVVGGYTLVDLRAEWNNFFGTNWDAAVNVINLTDKLYFVGNSGTLMFGAQSNGYGPPRMISVEVSTKF